MLCFYSLFYFKKKFTFLMPYLDSNICALCPWMILKQGQGYVNNLFIVLICHTDLVTIQTPVSGYLLPGIKLFKYAPVWWLFVDHVVMAVATPACKHIENCNLHTATLLIICFYYLLLNGVLSVYNATHCKTAHNLLLLLNSVLSVYNYFADLFFC